MFRDIDVQLKEFAKDMQENNKSLVNILTKVLIPNAVVPDGFGVGLSSDHISPATPARFNNVIPSTTSKNSGDTVLASNSSFSSTADISTSPLPLTGSFMSPSAGLTQNSSCHHVMLSDENIDTVLDDSFSYPSISVSNSASSSTPRRGNTNSSTLANSYASPPLFEENLMVQPIRSEEDSDELSSYTSPSTPERSHTNLCTSVSPYASSPMSEENLMVQPIRREDDSNSLVSNSHVLLSSYINSSTPARSYTNFRTSASSYGSSPMSDENLMVQPIRRGDDSNSLVSNSHVLSRSYTNSSTPARSYTNFCTSASSYGSSPMSDENLMVQPIRRGDDSNSLVSNSHVLSSSYTSSSTPARSYTSFHTPANNYGSSPMSEENLMVQPVTSIGNGSVLTSTSHVLSTANGISPQRNLLPSENINTDLILQNSSTIQVIREARRESCSRRNFSSKLVSRFFDEHTRSHSNVNGRRGKAKLNPAIMGHIKSITFQYYPLENFESEEKEWARCIIAIDSSSRSIGKQLSSSF